MGWEPENREDLLQLWSEPVLDRQHPVGWELDDRAGENLLEQWQRFGGKCKASTNIQHIINRVFFCEIL